MSANKKSSKIIDTNLTANNKVFSKTLVNKDKHFEKQMQKVFKSFFESPKTMLMVSFETEVLRANICRFISKWKAIGLIKEVYKGICPITKHKAGFYSTNNELFKAYCQTNKSF